MAILLNLVKSLSIVDPKYLKDWTVGKLTISVSRYLFILTGSVSPIVARGVRVSLC